MLIQILLSLFIVFTLIKVIGRFRAKEVSLGALVFWCMFWTIVLVVAWQPRLSTELANRLGVGRGTDLIMYVSVAALFYFIFRLTVRIEKMEKNITKVVREMAKKL
ncbi:MAG: DUF2304 family protein [Patescibacteria group bacterium]